MSTEPITPERLAAARELLAVARAECHRGSVERAWQACTEVAAIGRATDNAALMADAATIIGPGSSVGAWSLAAARHALAREALSLIGAGDADRATRLRAVLAATRDPWSAAEPPLAEPLSPAAAERRSARLHTGFAAATDPADLETRLDCTNELAGLAAATGRDDDAAWASLWRLEAYTRLGLRVELDAEIMRLAATVRRLGAPAWSWRLTAARASLVLLDGSVDQARRLSAEALREGARAGIEEAPYVDLVLRSSIAHRTGFGLAEVEPEVRQALAEAPFFAKGWHAGLLLRLCRTDEAMAIWRALAPRLADLPRAAPEWLVATAGHAELCAAAGDAEAAEFLIEQLTPYAELHIGGGLTPYEGPVGYALALLARTVGRLSTARELLRDAIARTERLHAPVFTAIANTALDDLAGRAGRSPCANSRSRGWSRSV